MAMMVEKIRENKIDKWNKLKESSSSSGSIIAISYLPVTNTLKIENKAKNTARSPNSSGLYILVNIGNSPIGIAWDKTVPPATVKIFLRNFFGVSIFFNMWN